MDAFLRSWPWEPWLTATLALTAAIYLRGWLELRRRDRHRWRPGQVAAFLGGLLAIFVALASPIEPFASLLLQVHMLQHLLLMMVAPPLIWMGAPLFPLLRGLPRSIRAYWIAPLLSARRVRRFFERLTHPCVAWTVYIAVTWLWHTPRGYELGLASSDWHLVEHACFLGRALLFWYPVVRPYPSRPSWSRWILFPYLILADLQNTVLAAWLTFSGNVLYPHYARAPRLGGLSALDDQAAAGVLMWVPGSIAFLFPLFWIGVGWLFGGDGERNRCKNKIDRSERPRAFPYRSPLLPVIDGRLPGARLPAAGGPRRSPAHAPFDVLRLPLIGRFLRGRRARLCLQLLVGVLAAAVIVDGLGGPQLSPMNLAGVLPWIHWRGVLILGLLVAGNVFCMACPFTLPRAIARRCLPGNWTWPRRLRNKWLAVFLLGLFLWSYEALALWDSPWWTAWIAVGYFVAAFAVDGFFRGAAFCKYVCPIGQFNFVQSLVSPLEVKVREAEICAVCSTQECIRGASDLPGCQMNLFLPRKVGNQDCTFCLDCVHACPHENVGLLAVVPAQALWRDPWRSGIGRFSRRRDLAALVVLLVFGAFANAAGMVGPVVDWQVEACSLPQLGKPPALLITSVYYLLTLLVLPAVAVGTAAFSSRAVGRANATVLDVATRYSYALVPLGFGMWLAHYSFHFLTSYGTIVPAVQRFIGELGCSLLGKPLWQCACCRPAADWILHSEMLMLDCGLLLSLYTGYRIAMAHPDAPRPLKAVAPWAVLIVLLFIAGVWIVLQPMQMRGTMTLVQG